MHNVTQYRCLSVLFITALFATALSGCESEGIVGTVCDEDSRASCEGRNITSCRTEDTGWYEWNGRRFFCTSQNCLGALADVYDACASLISPPPLQTTTFTIPMNCDDGRRVSVTVVYPVGSSPTEQAIEDARLEACAQ